MKLNKLNFFLCFYLLLSPIADILTGICIFKLGMPEAFIGSPSQILRFLFLAFSMYFVKGKNLRIACILFIYLLIIEISSFLYTQSINAYMSGINYSMKILYIYLFYCIVSAISKKVDDSYSLRLIDIYLFSACLYSLGIMIPTFLGIGIGSYSEGTFGQKGLYSSGNSLNVFLGISFCISLLRKNKDYWEAIQCLLLLSAIILLGTKTAFLFIIVGLLIFLRSKSYKVRVFSVISVFVLFLYCFNDIAMLLGNIYDVVFYRFENRDDLLTFILSGRNDYISDAFMSFFQSNWWPLKLLFGGGAFLSFRDEYFVGMQFDTLEMDLFDIFFMYGVVGLTVYILVIVYALKICNRVSKVLSFLFFLFFFHSVLAGHVVFDGLPIISGMMLYFMLVRYESVKAKYLL